MMKKSQNKNNLTLDERISNLKKQVMQNAITLRKKIRNGTVFKFKKFSKKQKKVLTWWNDKSPVKDKNGIIADGSIRAGKTLSMSLSFVLWAMTKFKGQNFIMAFTFYNIYIKTCNFIFKFLIVFNIYILQYLY